MFEGYYIEEKIDLSLDERIQKHPVVALSDEQKEYLREKCFGWFPSEFTKRIVKYNLLTASQKEDLKHDRNYFLGDSFIWFNRCLETFDPTRVAPFKHVKKSEDLNEHLERLAKIFASFLKIRTNRKCNQISERLRRKDKQYVPKTVQSAVDSFEYFFTEFDMNDFSDKLTTSEDKLNLDTYREEFNMIHEDFFEYYIKRYVFHLSDSRLKAEFSESYKTLRKIADEYISLMTDKTKK